jgi:hypothetical protein
MNPLGAQTQLTCFELASPVTRANTVFTRATSGKDTASPHHSGPGVPAVTRVLSEAARYRKKHVTNQLQQNKSHPQTPPGGGPHPDGQQFFYSRRSCKKSGATGFS